MVQETASADRSLDVPSRVQDPSPFLARVSYVNCFNIHLFSTSSVGDEEHVRRTTCRCSVAEWWVSHASFDVSDTFPSTPRTEGALVFRSHVSSALQFDAPSHTSACECDVGAHVQQSTSTRASISTDDVFEKAHRTRAKRIPKSPPPFPILVRLSPSFPGRWRRTKEGRQDPRDGREYFLGGWGVGLDRDHGSSYRDLRARNRDLGKTDANSRDRQLHTSKPTTDERAIA